MSQIAAARSPEVKLSFSCQTPAKKTKPSVNKDAPTPSATPSHHQPTGCNTKRKTVFNAIKAKANMASALPARKSMACKPVKKKTGAIRNASSRIRNAFIFCLPQSHCPHIHLYGIHKQIPATTHAHRFQATASASRVRSALGAEGCRAASIAARATIGA